MVIAVPWSAGSAGASRTVESGATRSTGSVVTRSTGTGTPGFSAASFAASSEPVTRYRQLQDSDTGRYGHLADTLIGQGVWVARRGIWYVSAAHTAADISETADRIESAFQMFTAAGRAS